MICRDYIWKVLAWGGKKNALLECKGGIIFPLQDLMGKQLFISAKKKPFSAGHSRGDGNLERRRISEYVSFRTARTRWMPHWNAILDVAGDLSPRAFRATVCVLANMNVRDYVSLCDRVCANVIHSHVPESSISFQPSHSCWFGRAFPVCCAAPCAAVSASPRCVWSGREALTAPSSWLGMLRELDGSGSGEERRAREKADGEGCSPLHPAGFILTSFPRAPHTSWNSLNYAPSMARRSKWRSKRVSSDRLRTLEKLHHSTSSNKIRAGTGCVQWIYMSLFCVFFKIFYICIYIFLAFHL